MPWPLSDAVAVERFSVDCTELGLDRCCLVWMTLLLSSGLARFSIRGADAGRIVCLLASAGMLVFRSSLAEELDFIPAMYRFLRSIMLLLRLAFPRASAVRTRGAEAERISVGMLVLRSCLVVPLMYLLTGVLLSSIMLLSRSHLPRGVSRGADAGLAEGSAGIVVFKSILLRRTGIADALLRADALCASRRSLGVDPGRPAAFGFGTLAWPSALCGRRRAALAFFETGHGRSRLLRRSVGPTDAGRGGGS